MAEQIISPGVFTEELDASYLPQGIASIGAAFIGPTLKGPAMVPTSVTSMEDFIQKFGPTNPNLYLPYAAKEYLANSNQLTVVRTMHDDGYIVKDVMALVVSSGSVSASVAVFHPSQILTDTGSFYDETTSLFEKSAFSVSSGSNSFIFKISGSYTVDSSTFTSAKNTNTAIYSGSLDTANANYLTKIFGKNPTSTVDPAYLYTIFETSPSSSLGANYLNATMSIQLGTMNFSTQYSEASTPWIISQTVNGTNYELFKFHTISAGNNSNYEYKVAITNVKAAGSVPGSEYGSFSVIIRKVDQDKLAAFGSPFVATDTDIRQNVVENYENVTLDPSSKRYIAKVIGDRYYTSTNGRITVNGDYANKSKCVYVEVNENVKNAVYSPELVPFGFAALYNPLPSTFTNVPVAVMKTTQTDTNGVYNKRVLFGFDYTVTDNLNYLKPIPYVSASVGSNTRFLLSDYAQDYSATTSHYTGSIDLSSNTSIESRKFVVPFQGGFDGIQPNRRALVGSDITAANTQGFDLSSLTSSDYSVYTNAITTVSNPDEIDINMVVMPGVIQQYHPIITSFASSMCQDRADTFFVFDASGLTATIEETISYVSDIDNNYSATYYPWVKVIDSNTNRPLWVPPSVVVPGVIAFNDKVSADWYAPAGLNRGGLTNVIDAYVRLTHAERDELYEDRINPIATFPGKGVVVWGQKTLQAKPSALDRVNVRRLLIAVKKYIASTSKYLVFEHNTSATRNKFLNIVNPYLESVQSRSGIYNFRVVCDETNNTPEQIDRGVLNCQLWLQPTRVVEYIKIDFSISSTGATFES